MGNQAPTSRRTDSAAPMTLTDRQKGVRSLVRKFGSQLEAALPKCGLTPERLLRVIFTALSKTPELYECTETSLIAAVMTSAQLGLMPDGTLGMAYLIPYNNKRLGCKEAQFQIGYRGLMALARRSGQIATLESVVVRRSDVFDWERGSAPFIKHKPRLTPFGGLPEGEDPGLWALHNGEPIVAVYAIAKLTNGETQFEVMPTHEIERLRYDSSAAAESGPWVTHWPQMARKTVVKRLCPYLPASTELTRAVNLDELSTIGKGQNLEAEAGLVDLGVAQVVEDAGVAAQARGAQRETQRQHEGDVTLEPCGVCEQPSAARDLEQREDLRVCKACISMSEDPAPGRLFDDEDGDRGAAAGGGE